jgi:putative ABC transport system permease protein
MTKPKPSKLPVWVKVALRELINNRAFSVPFIINLCIGLTGFLLLDTFKNSISDYLDSRSQILIGGDMTISSSQLMTEDTTKEFLSMLPTGTRTRQEKVLFSMVSYGESSRLVEVKAVEGTYPFAGTLTLKDKGATTDKDWQSLNDERNVWIYPELVAQMDIHTGDTLKIGAHDFKVAGIIDFDPYVASSSMAFTPRVLIGLNHLDETGLITVGSRVFHTYVVGLPNQAPETMLEDLAATLKKDIKTPNIRIKTHRVAGQDMNRALIYLNDFLGLVSMVALFLAGVGTSFLFRSHIKKRFREIAILLSLGMQRRTAKLVYIFQIVLLGAIATFFSSLLSWLLLPLIPVVFGPVFPEGLTVQPQFLSILFAFSVGAGGAILVCWPLVQSLNRLPASALFSESFSVDAGTEKIQFLSWLPALLMFLLLSVQQAHSIKVGSLFVGVFLAAFVLFWVLGLATLKIIGTTIDGLSLRGRIAVLNLTRFRSASLTAFSSIALSSLLMNLIPQIRNSIESEISINPKEKRPALFLFDIQEEQVEGLSTLLKSLNTKLEFESPMVRARLVSINDEPVKDRQQDDTATREQEFEQRNLSRTYNLSYRSAFTSSETIEKGEAFTGTWKAGEGSDLPLMSLEVRFAERLGVDIGDSMTFDIHGVEVKGKVANLRKIRWTSFQPNFFVQFQPGVIDDAPKTFLAAVDAPTQDEKNMLQNQIVRQFPNISVIDVTNTIVRILTMVNQMTFAITFMSILTLLAGFAVLFAIVNHQLQRRIPDITLLKILGSQFSTVRNATLSEFMIVGFLASSAGAIISILVSWIVSKIVFDGVWTPDGLTPVITVAATTGLAVLTGWLGSMRALAAKPATLLGAPAFK